LATDRLKWLILPPIFVAAFAAYGIARAQTPPPPETISIPVAGGITDPSGITYQFKGTVTFPKPAPAITLPPGPVLYGLQDLAGTYLQVPIMGTAVIAQGRNLGATKGRLFWGPQELTPTAWSDTEIKFTLPNEPLHPRGHLLTIYRADGAWYSSLVASQ
jgi:hypothetical protein